MTARTVSDDPQPQIVSSFRFNKVKDGWTLLGDTTAPTLPVSDLELVSFLKRGENRISEEEMRERAKEMRADLGQREAEHLLDHQDEIPVSWREFDLIFPGTLWRDSFGGLSVPYLGWFGDRWGLCLSWLDRDWDSVGRLVRPRE